MARPGLNGEIITHACISLCDGDVYAAAAATGVASARLVGLLSVGHPQANFERALKKSLEVYEQVARDARERGK